MADNRCLRSLLQFTVDVYVDAWMNRFPSESPARRKRRPLSPSLPQSQPFPSPFSFFSFFSVQARHVPFKFASCEPGPWTRFLEQIMGGFRDIDVVCGAIRCALMPHLPPTLPTKQADTLLAGLFLALAVLSVYLLV